MAQVRETELDGGALARALWRRAWLVVLLPALVAIGTYLALSRVEPLYTADTSILIEERESPLTRPREEVLLPVGIDESAIQSQVEVLRSREIAEAVIDRLDLIRRPEFDPATRPSLVASLMVLLGVREHPTDESIRQRVMESYFERLTVYPLQKSRVIAVEFQAPEPALAAEVANAVAEAFVDLQQDAKRESAVAATAWLQQEIERLRGRVEEAEQAVADYRASNALYDVNQSGNLSTQQLGDINAELARARAARAEAEARARLVQELLAEGGSLEASQEVLNSQLVQRLQERQVTLRSQIAELSTTLLPGHPRIRALQGQLGNLEGQIREEARKIQVSLNTAARVAAAREQSLVASLDTATVDVSRSDEQEIELRALEREAAAQRGLLESLLARYREALARTDADYLPADARIISRAVAPSDPSYPKKAMMSVAAGLATFLLLTALLLLRELTTGRAFRVVDYGMAEAPGTWREPTGSALVPVGYAAASPAFRLAPDAEVAPEPLQPGPDTEAVIIPPVATEAAISPATEADPIGMPSIPVEEPIPEMDEADRPGTAELAEILGSEAVRVAVFAGAEGGEGAGDIAFAAARRSAQDNVRIVLLDVGPTPSDVLGGYERPGLGDLIAGEASFGEVIQRDDSGVHFIPMGAIASRLPFHRLGIAVGALTHTYDKVVVVANALQDWPHEQVKPDLAAIVCAPETTELLRKEAYDAALERGAVTALIVRYTSDDFPDRASAASEAA